MYVGDSIAHNVNFPHIENKTSTRIRTKKAYSVVFDKDAKYPQKNVEDVTRAALEDTPSEDKYRQLVIGAPFHRPKIRGAKKQNYVETKLFTMSQFPTVFFHAPLLSPEC